MADLVNVIFVSEFIVSILIFLAKLLNVMTVGKFYQIKEEENDNRVKKYMCFSMPVLLFILSIILLGIGNICVMTRLDTFVSLMYQYQSFLFKISILLFIIEIFYYIAGNTTTGSKEAYNSLENTYNKKSKSILRF